MQVKMARKTLEQKLVLGTLLFFAVVSLVVVRLYEPDLPEAVSIDITDQPVIGNPFAPLEIVLFLDPKCPNCKRYHEEIVPEIRYMWIENNYAKLAMVPLCFLAGSRAAGMAILEVHHQNPDLFSHYLDKVYEHQGEELEDWCTVELLSRLADEVSGIDCGEVEAAILSARYAAALDHNLALALSVMRGELVTPACFIDGRQVRGLSASDVDDLAEKTLQYYGID
jgi:protein-disulfide isomerase